MPYYDYQCEQCGCTQEVYQGFNDKRLVKCPLCSQDTFVRLIGNPMIFVKGEVKTLQQQAEANSKKFGKRECQERELKSKEAYKEARRKLGVPVKEKAEGNPWWRSGAVKGLDKSDKPISQAQCEKYTKELRELGSNVKINATPKKKTKGG